MSGSHQGRRTEGQSAWPDEKLRRRLEEADLAALTHMHALSARLLGAGGLEPLLQEIMDVAVAIVGAERGTLQLIKGDSLRIVAHYGHQRPFLEFFASAEARASVCGESMKRGQRVIVEDVEHSPLFADTESLKVLREAGVRAVQSTPLLTRQGKLLGILTTQWAVPHVPDEHDLWRIDLLARQGADLIEHKRAEEAASRSQRTFFELVERPPFGIYIVDSQFRIAHMNAGSQTGAFRNVRPVIGRDFAEAMRILWPEPVAVGIIAVFRHTLETGEPYYSPRFVNPRHDVQTVEAYEWELHRMTLPDGQYGVICYYFDSTELREAEEARRVSEQRVTSILETMSDCFVTFDRDWRYTYINAAAAKAFHMTPQQLLGTTLWEVWPAAYDLPLGVSFRRALAENISIQFEQFYPGPLNRWFECRCHPTPEGLATFFSDITERKQAEAALRQSEDRFRTMANAIPQLAWIARADGYIYWYNQRWYDYTGTTPEQMEGWGWQSVHDPQELPTVLERWKSSIATGQPFDMIFPLRGADGIFRPFLTRVMPLTDEQGRVQQWFGTNTDVSEQKRAEEALRESEAGLAAAQRLAHVGSWQWNIAADTARWSEETFRIFALARGPLQQHRVDFISRIVPEDRQRVDQALSDALSGTRDYGLDYRIRLPDGRERVIHAQAQVLRSSDGRPVMMYGTVQDITERKQAEETLQELNATLESKVAQRTAQLEYRARQLQKLTLELSQAEERERRRIAVILHEDLQQQIAGAKFHLTLVRNRAKDERLRAEVEGVDAMLKEAIEKSRSLSHDLSPAVLHLNDLAELLQWLANRVRGQQGLNVNVDISGDMTLQSEALATFLFRAAQEMLFNVVQHAHVRAAAIRVRRIGRYVGVSVSDQGCGFDPQELQETPGVGLFSIRERTELLGGRLKVKSATGKGSRFRIVVPDSPKEKNGERTTEEVTYAGAPASPPSANGAVRVLVVDDHDIVRGGLAAMLREAPGLEVVGEAPDGREAINMTIALHPDVVLMDVSMPLLGGDQATRQIKTLLPGTRVIALSMYDEADKKEKMYRAGAESYVLKTAPSEELLAAIRGR